ncbi:MAG: BatD family protein [Deltaproteobacteria bacterium]|nr:BatD family protein [Deltaproteobacteria bacterium]
MVGLRCTRLILLVLLLATDGSAELPCLATVSLEPDEAFVGQQVLYILHIEQRRDVARVRFQPPLSFPSMRSEWLPTVRLPDPDEGTRATQERRALHPGHAGELRIPEAGLLCETPTGSHLARVPSIGLHVQPVPTADRPDDWSGLVGPLSLQWSLQPDHVALGETARLNVRIEGPGTLWRVDPGVERMLAPGDADIFVLATDEQRDKGRSFSIRTYRRYDVVPRRVGELVFPGLRVASFDPANERFEEHVLPDLTLRVSAAAPPPRPSATEAGAQPAAKEGSTHPAGASKLPGFWLVLGGIAFAALLVSGALWLRRRLARPPARAEVARHLLAEAASSLDRGDATLAATAMANCLATLTRNAAGMDDDPFAAEGASPASREFALLAGRLERARFSGAVDAQELRAIATELGARLVTDGTTDC